MQRIRGNDEQQWQEVIDNAIDRRRYVDVTTPSGADIQFAIEHGLGRVPLGFIVIDQESAAVTYKSDGSAWDETNIYLKCNVGSAILRILIF